MEKAIEEAINSGESMFLVDDVRDMMTPEEYDVAVLRIKNEFFSSLQQIVDNLASEFSDYNEEPSDHFDELRSNLDTLRSVIEGPEIEDAVALGESLIEDAVSGLNEQKRKFEREEARKAIDWNEDDGMRSMVRKNENEQNQSSSDGAEPLKPLNGHREKRSIFDDVDL